MLAVQTPPSEKSQCQPFASLRDKQKRRFMEEPTQTFLHFIYLSDIEITLIVLFRIEITDASYSIL